MFALDPRSDMSKLQYWHVVEIVERTVYSYPGVSGSKSYSMLSDGWGNNAMCCRSGHCYESTARLCGHHFSTHLNSFHGIYDPLCEFVQEQI